MPRLNELQSAFATGRPAVATVQTRNWDTPVEEVLVKDQRAQRTTSQMLEDKLRRLLCFRESSKRT